MRVVLSETHTLSAAILNLTKMNLAVACSPHGVGVVDTDVLSLLDVHCCPDHHSGQQNGHCGEIDPAKNADSTTMYLF